MIAGGEKLKCTIDIEKNLENSWHLIICGNKRKLIISNRGFTFYNGIAINERKKKKIKQDDIFNLRQNKFETSRTTRRKCSK